jgi:threonine/homoserine/homoserine lactone efflux protein
LQAISNDKSFQNWFGLACGLLLLIFGAVALFARQRDLSKELEGDAAPVAKKRYAYLQGLLINFTNPSNWLFWLSVATIAKSEAPADNPYYAKIFMFSALLALCSTDLTKVLLAHKIGGWLKPGVPEKIVRFAGGILVCLSSWLLWSVAERW